MADDRRALLRRQLLKEQLSQEASPEAAPVVAIQPDQAKLPGSKLDTSKMSPEEIAAEDERLRNESNMQQIIKPAAAGMAQGATLGFSDELGGMADTAGDVISGKLPADLTSSPLLAKYREYQKSREGANKALQEQSPGAYGVGELAGGLAPAALMPSVGAEQLGARFSPKVAQFLAGKMGGAGAKLAGKAAAGVIEGAPVGGAIGAGTSEHGLDEPGALASDIASGAEMGSATGAGLNLAGKTGKMAMDKMSSLTEDSPYMRQIKLAYKYGADKGVNLGSGSAQEGLSTMPIDAAKDLTSRMKLVDDQLGQKVGDSIQKAQQSGMKINIDPDIQDASQKMFQTLFVDNPTLGQTLDPKTSQLLKAIAQRDTGDLTPVEAKAMRDQLRDLTSNLAGYNSDASNFARGLSSKLAKSLDNSLKDQIPNYKTAASQFEEFRRMVPETVMSKGTPDEYGKVFMGDLKNPELKLFEANKDMLSSAQLPGTAAQGQRATLQKLRENLRALQQQNPEAVKTLGGTADEVIKKISDKSDELAMLGRVQGVDPHAEVGKYASGQLFGVSTGAGGVGMSIANKVGRGVSNASQSAPVKLGGAVFGAADDALMNVAQKLKASSSMSGTGEALEKALQNKDVVSKNAVLFKLMQNPDYRKMLSESTGDGNE